MDIRKIKKLIELLEESGLAELEIQEKDEAIRLSRYSQHAPVAAAPAQIVQAAAAPAAAPAVEALEPDVPDGQIIRAPMVGTYYASPSPESEAYVKVGSTIESGDPVCIIEAMKMFNTIETEFSGKVVSVMVENGQPVEYDQALFVVR